MERNGRSAATPVGTVRTLVPLTSRGEEDRYWYDAGDRGAGSLGWSVGGLAFGVDCFACDDDGLDVAWSCVDLRSGH